MRNFEETSNGWNLEDEGKAVRGNYDFFIEESFKDTNGDTRYLVVYAPNDYEEAISFLNTNSDRVLGLWTYKHPETPNGYLPMAWTEAYDKENYGN